jgi:hypothetical protein
MKHINIKPYGTTVKTPEGDKTIPYDVKGSLAAIIFHPALKIDGREAIIRDKLATKIETTEGNDLYLEESDYNKITAALNVVERFGRADVEFLKRINDAENVDIEKALTIRGIADDKEPKKSVKG